MPEGDRVESILADWLDQREKGHAPDPAALIRAHPDLAEALQRRFAALNLVDLALAPDPRPEPEIPERLGPYRIEEMLGQGGMGTVYRATTESKMRLFDAGQTVALKLIHSHLLQSPGFFKRFLREAEIGQSVDHPNVVRTYDADALAEGDRSYHFLVMEYVEGQTLHDLQIELDRVPEDLCRHIASETAKGLAAIHAAGVIHRDLKPENVIITEDHAVKVMDLGVARLAEEAIRLSQTGHFVGSVEYASPEQFTAKSDGLDGRSDLFSLGVLLYELATGQHPFRGDSTKVVLQRILQEEPRKAGQVNPQLSPFLEELIDQLLCKKPDDRFASAADLLVALEAAEGGHWWKAKARTLQLTTKRPLRRIRIPRETALYGRDDDLAKLRALYEQAKAGDGQVLLIEGEAGIGKTRLVDEFVGRLRQEGDDINFVFGSYPPGGAATAAGAFAEAYREQFGAEGLEDTLKDYVTPTPILIPAFAALLRGETTPMGAEALTKDSLQTVFIHATRGLAAELTTIVLIDDLHFAPEAGRALFSSMAMAVPGHRLLLVGTMRPGVPEDWVANVERLDHAAKRSLSRLGPKDLVALLKDAFRSERLANELGIRIAEKSDGNPFFAFEIIRGLREGQFITQKPDGTWVTTEVIRDIQVPSSVLDLVNARVADLSEEERDLLDVASCCGFTFDPSLIADAARMPLIPALRRFGQIERRHRLVRTAGPACAFDHHQVQEAIYGSLMPKLREAYHAAIAEAMEARAGVEDTDPKDLDGALCADLCEHLLKGADGERALRYLDEALTYLEREFLNDHAIALADRALEVPGLLQGDTRVALLLRKAAPLDLLGKREAQAGVLEEAKVLAESVGDLRLLGAVELATGVLLVHVSRLDEARKHCERSLTLARETGDMDGEAAATINLGVVFRNLGRHVEARDHYEGGLALAKACRNRKWESNATGNLVNAFSALGRYEEARVHGERSLVIAREVGDRKGEAGTECNLGVVSQSLGHYQKARGHFERGLAIAREIGDRKGEGHTTANLGHVCGILGCYEEEREHWERSIAITCELGNRMGEAIATAHQGAMALGLGRCEEARERFERSFALARELGNQAIEASVAGLLGLLWLTLGQMDRARRMLDASLKLSRKTSVRDTEGHTLRALAALAAEEGDAEGAARLAEEALALLREIGFEAGVPDSLIQLGELLWQGGDLDTAREAFEEAVGLLRKQHRKPEMTEALAVMARFPGGAIEVALSALDDAGERGNTPKVRYHLWKASGDPAHLQEAKRLLDHRVEQAPEDCRDSMLKNVRLHREIMGAWAEHEEEAQIEGSF